MTLSRQSLAGVWRFELDPTASKGFTLGQSSGALAHLHDEIHLPGSTDEAGKGIPNSKIHLDHLSRPYVYVGPAWYQREIKIPESWQGKHIRLFLERCHWESVAWLNKDCLGRQNSLSTPHIYELGQLAPGTYTLTLRIDNTPKIAVGDAITFTGSFNLAHSLTDHTQTNWNGIIGRLELQAYEPVMIENIQIYPDGLNKTARAHVCLYNASGQWFKGRLRLSISQGLEVLAERNIELEFDGTTHAFTEAFELKKANLWDEFDPALLVLKAELGDEVSSCPFGLRSFYAKGKHLYLNERQVFLRGTLECCVFPLTAYPPTDKASWLKLIETAKSYGLNHLRFHSWCPPEAAFEAADELGFMVQVEGPFWAEFGSDIELDAYAFSESKAILKSYGNHPSFCMFAISNEPSGKTMNDFFAELLIELKEDNRRLYTSGAGWPMIDENDYHLTHHPRSYQWLEGLNARFNATPFQTVDYRDFMAEQTKPIVSHEIGQWTSYPDYEQIDKYTGVLKPRNLEAFSQSLAQNGLAAMNQDFVQASGKLQTLLYKEEIEAALRTPDFGGFQLLDLHDFPGQGTALVGVLDAFWAAKPYTKAQDFREFCSETVLLARFDKVSYSSGETLSVQIEIAHFGPAPLKGQTVQWELSDTQTVLKGEVSVDVIPLGSGIPLANIAVPLAEFNAPSQLRLCLELSGTAIYNHWDFWLYPENLDLDSDILLSQDLDQKTLEHLEQGKSVLLAMPAEGIANTIPFGFTTAFWNVAWTAGQAPHTQGILCDPGHPALAYFPTQFHSNWQWWELIQGSKCLICETLKTKPIIQVIDDWRSNRKLALAVEFKLGTGKVLLCSANLFGKDSGLVSRQLLYSFQQYIKSPEFNPEEGLNLAQLKALIDTK